MITIMNKIIVNNIEYEWDYRIPRAGKGINVFRNGDFLFGIPGKEKIDDEEIKSHILIHLMYENEA